MRTTPSSFSARCRSAWNLVRSSVSWDEPDPGKTTISRLLFGSMPTAGAVRLGGDPHLDDLRRRVALVTQDVQLFAGHAARQRHAVRPVRRRRCAPFVFASLDLDRWLDDLSNGFDTVLGATGRGLSAGE